MAVEHSGPIARLRDGTAVAGWMFKANPDVWDVLAFLRTGAEFDAWRMAPSYRVELVGPGHPCVLWVTGPATSPYMPGVWAIGEVVSDRYEDVGDPDDPLWRDVGKRRQVRPYVQIRMTALSEPVSRAELREDEAFEQAEILKRPRMGSPLALRAEELAVIEARAGSPARRRRR
ncbi:MAG TPA: EVE domain-containing protein [Microthrixaceae bacterium]|nr:EVE domain-containing protein [Microthrixaceae bacterium]